MKKRVYEKLSGLSTQERAERIKIQKRQSKQRSREREKAIAAGLPYEPKRLVNEDKTEEEIRQRKKELDKDNKNKKKEEINKIFFEKEFIDKFPDCNKHYLSRYIRMIERAPSISENFEKHHILPRCYWPEYDKTKQNLVKLSYRMHFIAHWLLAKIIANDPKLNFAFYRMCYLPKHEKNITKCSKFFEQVRLASVQENSRLQKAKLKKGKHPFQRKKTIKNKIKYMKSDLHPMKVASRNGTHHNSNICPWRNFNTKEKSIRTWGTADKCLDIYRQNSQIGVTKLYNTLKKEVSDEISIKSLERIIKRLKNGWNPVEDSEWTDFFKKGVDNPSEVI